MQYFTPPPLPFSKYVDVPAFIEKFYGRSVRYDTNDVLALMRWASVERLDAIAYLEARMDSASLNYARFLREKTSLADILARSDFFSDMILGMNEDSWNGLTSRQRRELRKAYDIYQNLPKRRR